MIRSELSPSDSVGHRSLESAAGSGVAGGMQSVATLLELATCAVEVAAGVATSTVIDNGEPVSEFELHAPSSATHSEVVSAKVFIGQTKRRNRSTIRGMTGMARLVRRVQSGSARRVQPELAHRASVENPELGRATAWKVMGVIETSIERSSPGHTLPTVD